MISKFVLRKCKFRHIFFEHKIEMFVDVEGEPFPIGIIEVEELVEYGLWFDIHEKFN